MLEAVAANPALQGAHVIMMALVKQGIEGETPAVRQCAVEALAEMYNGTGLSFSVLKGSFETRYHLMRCPHASMPCAQMPDQ